MTTQTRPSSAVANLTSASATSAIPEASSSSTAPERSTTSGTTGTTTTLPSLATQPAVVGRLVVRAHGAVFARVGSVALLHPAREVERVAFHQSNHDGAKQMSIGAEAVAAIELPSRDRDTASRGAADIVIAPDSPILAPATGTVLRAGGYVLYCEHDDGFVVIEPDSHPGLELKLLHISGLQVEIGDRVEAGVTVLADGATSLPFDSQVDAYTAEPSWPHVHVEVVDPSIPDRPSEGSC